MLNDHAAEPDGVVGAGAEWGVTSLVLGSVLLLMAPLVMLVIVEGLATGYPLWTSHELRLAAYLMQVAVSFLLLLCLVALVCGLKGLRSAAAAGRPLGLPTGGAIVCVMASILWIIVALATVLIAGWARHRKEEGLPLPISAPAAPGLPRSPRP